MSWDSAGPEAETSSQQVECSLACLEQERHQRQGSQGQAEWRRPDQDIEDKILLLQTEVEKAQWRLDQMTHSLLAQSPARGYPNTLQVPEVPVPLRKQLEAQESHPRLHEEMAEYWRTRWHQVAVALKFKEEELQRLQRQSGTWPPQGMQFNPERLQFASCYLPGWVVWFGCDLGPQASSCSLLLFPSCNHRTLTQLQRGQTVC
ncbi:uncharacterized protein [Macaca fascicularis]|uniref:uncharacterized protein n=1 Tax=Macaca fascicularis TaxID=9541 RepID=UPI0032B038EC